MLRACHLQINILLDLKVEENTEDMIHKGAFTGILLDTLYARAGKKHQLIENSSDLAAAIGCVMYLRWSIWYLLGRH